MTTFDYVPHVDDIPWDYYRGFRIYRNLHKKCYTVQAWNTDKKGWRVWAHADSLVAVGCEFKVSQAGRDRVLREGRKNVHAYIYAADVVGDNLARATTRYSVPIRYNPFIAGVFFMTPTLKRFRNESLTPVTAAKRVWLTEDGRMLGRHLPNPERVGP